MPKTLLVLVVLLASGSYALAQEKTYASPDKRLRGILIPVENKGSAAYESRVEIRTPGGRVLRWRSFASPDRNHGEGVARAEWSADGEFFIFNTISSGGHQPWHIATYFYSRRKNKFYSLDRFIGPITSDFKLAAQNTVMTTRFNFNRNEEKEPVLVSLQSLRAK